MNSPSPSEEASAAGGGALLAGGVTAILASTCCLGPLVLLSIGVSGAWIGDLAALEPYRPWFIAASAASLFFAWRRIWRPAGDCAPGEVCAVPRVKRAYKALFGLVAALLVVALGYPYVAPLFY